MSEKVDNPLEIARQMGQRSSQEKRVAEWVDVERPESFDSFEKFLETRPYLDKEGLALTANGQPLESLHTVESVSAEQKGPTELENVSDFEMIEEAIKDLLSKEYDHRRQHSRTVIVDLLKENTQSMTHSEIDQLAEQQQQAGNKYVARLLKAKAKALSQDTADEESVSIEVEPEDQTKELKPVSHEPQVQEVEPEELSTDDIQPPKAVEILPAGDDDGGQPGVGEVDTTEIDLLADIAPLAEAGDNSVEKLEGQAATILEDILSYRVQLVVARSSGDNDKAARFQELIDKGFDNLRRITGEEFGEETVETILRMADAERRSTEADHELTAPVDAEESLDDTERLARIYDLKTEAIPKLKAHLAYSELINDKKTAKLIQSQIEAALNDIKQLSGDDLSDEAISEIEQQTTNALVNEKKVELAYELQERILVPDIKNLISLELLGRASRKDRKEKDRLKAKVKTGVDLIARKLAGLSDEDVRKFGEEAWEKANEAISTATQEDSPA